MPRDSYDSPVSPMLTTAVPEGWDRYAIQAYLADSTDPRLPKRLAIQSKFPNANNSPLRNEHRVHHPSFGTSMLVSGDDSLPAMGTDPSADNTFSISTSIGRQALENPRLLVQGERGDLLLPPPPSRLILECPFNWLSCTRTFSEMDDWFIHSITHFKPAGPPIHSNCCFCDARFQGQNGLQTWACRLQHVACHHQLGHRLAHARPDFAMHKYLWQNRLISTAVYKGLMPYDGGSLENVTPCTISSASSRKGRGRRAGTKRKSEGIS